VVSISDAPKRGPLGAAMLLLALLIIAPRAEAQFVQQGTKLVGTGAVGNAEQGFSVAVSADGNTAVVGAPNDNDKAGAAWVWTRSGGVWIQQGAKLVGTDSVGTAYQGYSVAVSADGNTVVVGGITDNNVTGAAWVWTRSGGVWSQQGTKLVGADAAGESRQGNSVAVSADGNTAVVGGIWDDNYAGAAWAWTRSDGVWSQQGTKLVGTGAVGVIRLQGNSVAVSADGNTAVVGGPGAGAAWAWTRSGAVWSQQGAKLVGADAVGSGDQGFSVAVSADGNTAVVGGYGDNASAGAAWVWTRSAGVWSQQGTKLVGTGAVGNAQQGVSVAVSADGNIAMVGGSSDNSSAGAVWVWTRSGGVWSQQGKLVGTGAAGHASQGTSVALSADGSTAVVGGASDNHGAGAVWMWTTGNTAVPGDSPLAFALKGVQPNPASGRDLTVQFVLPMRAAARLDLFDVAGRSVVTRDVGVLGPGAHAVNLADQTPVRPGLYFVRLQQGAKEGVTRVAVLQ